MATIWIIAFVLGLIAVCVSLWVTFWVVLFVVEFVKFGHRDLAYRRIILASMLACNGRLLCEKRNGKGKRLVKSGWLRGGLLSHEKNEKRVIIALLLHGLIGLAYSEKLSFSILP